MSVIPSSAKRVKLSTHAEINDIIQRQTADNLKRYLHSDNKTLTTRLEELNREWDTERVLETNASLIIFISSIIGIFTSPYWFLLTGIISLFFLQHALQGWCPPLPILRKLGVRTPEEINAEKAVIRTLRGDFSDINKNPDDIIKHLLDDSDKQGIY